MALAALATQPSLASRISVAVLLAPVAFTAHTRSYPIRTMASMDTEQVRGLATPVWCNAAPGPSPPRFPLRGPSAITPTDRRGGGARERLSRLTAARCRIQPLPSVRYPWDSDLPAALPQQACLHGSCVLPQSLLQNRHDYSLSPSSVPPASSFLLCSLFSLCLCLCLSVSLSLSLSLSVSLSLPAAPVFLFVCLPLCISLSVSEFLQSPAALPALHSPGGQCTTTAEHRSQADTLDSPAP